MKELGGTNGLSRRDFLRSGLVFGVGAQALSSGYAAVPDVFARAVLSAKSAALQNDKVLVMIQLGGRNDGLQTVIPISSSSYRDFRPQLSAAAAKAQPISKDLGLHENLKGIKTLFDSGKVAIVQGVGYTNPSFSHYDSAGHPLVGCACGTTNVPGMLRDLQATLTVIDDVKTFGFQGGQNVEDVMGTLYKSTPGIYGALFDTAMTTVRDTVAQLRTSSAKYTPKGNYSDKVNLVYSSKNQLAAALQLAAELITTGTGVKLLHVTLGGFDTHYTELNRHDDLMGYLDAAVSAFYQDLAAHHMADK